MSELKENKDFEWASSFYLYDDLDKSWVDLNEKKLFEKLEELAWQPFKNWSGEDLYKEIENLATSVRSYINKEKKI
jgi:hypothetical protein